MKIKPKNNFILLETYEVPRESGKIILTNAPKDTQIYKVISGENIIEDGTLIYLKCHPKSITQGDKVYYIAEIDDVMANVEL